MDLVSLLTSTTSKEEPNPNAWDITKAYYDASAFAWDLSQFAVRSGIGNVSDQGSSTTGLFLKPDGTKVYVLSQDFDQVGEYNISTAWRIATVTNPSLVQNFSVASQDGEPKGIFFKPDGTKMYMVGDDGDDVNEYSLSSAWDISTASYVQNFSVNSQETSPQDVFFRDDGTKMYVLGDTGNDVNEYSLSSAWDISTASYVQNFSVATQETSPTGLFFKPDGTKMYVIGSDGDDVNEYDLSSAWDISTASYVQNFSVASQSTSPQGIYFRPDGTMFYIMAGGEMYQYNIFKGFSVASQETVPEDIFVKPDGTKMYILGDNGNDVNEYDLSTPWDVFSASYVQNFSVATEETIPTGLFFKPDGTKMYVCGRSGDDVNEYNLSSAWDISTASYLQNFSVSAQETQPEGLFFKPDGTKMYIIGQTGDDINQYDLSSAWDISTASYVQNFSVSSKLSIPKTVTFKPDGTKMYVAGNGDFIFEYSLSTPWDISTATFSADSFDLRIYGLNPTGLSWKDDGTQFFSVSSSDDTVYSFLISPT